MDDKMQREGMGDYDFNWDTTITDEKEKLKWVLSQYSQWVKYILEKNDLKYSDYMPDMGTDDQGSDAAFDWKMILEFETKKLLGS